MKRFYLLWFLLIFALVACGGGGNTAEPAGDESEPEPEEETVVEESVDPETGLPLNPETNPGGEFIIEGPISSVTAIPQDSPEFVIEIPSGKRYRVRSQPLSETFFEDGTAVVATQIRQGMMVRATVIFVADAGELGEFQSHDLMFLHVDE